MKSVSEIGPLGNERRLGILGGTFDPVHNGHLGLAREALLKLRLDRILFIPVNMSPHKLEKNSVAAEHRLRMVQLALASEPRFSVTDMEAASPGPSYTVETLERLRNGLQPECEMFLILGRDAFRDFERWRNPRRILELCHLVVATRSGNLNGPESLPSGLDAGYFRSEDGGIPDASVFRNEKTGRLAVFLRITPIDISASEIRLRVSCGDPVKNLLPPPVEHYIMVHHLYQAQPQPGI